MKKVVLAVSLCIASSGALAAKSCEELKSEIDARIKANGVPVYTLEIVAADAPEDGKVVGTCEGGQKKIIYKRG